MTEQMMCEHCGRVIEWSAEDYAWVDPEATGDDWTWRETCDKHDTFIADHEPKNTHEIDPATEEPWPIEEGCCSFHFP